jgi:hypothetical protein
LINIFGCKEKEWRVALRICKKNAILAGGAGRAKLGNGTADREWDAVRA